MLKLISARISIWQDPGASANGQLNTFFVSSDKKWFYSLGFAEGITMKKQDNLKIVLLECALFLMILEAVYQFFYSLHGAVEHSLLFSCQIEFDYLLDATGSKDAGYSNVVTADAEFAVEHSADR